LATIHFKEQNSQLLLENKTSSKEDRDNYENLQNEYKKLFEKYEQIKNEDPQNPKLQETVKELDEKQKELQKTLSKIS
jgi:hypothetical protein